MANVIEEAAKNKRGVNCINYYGDRAACGWYRMSFPAMTLETLLGSNVIFRFMETQAPILDRNYYAANEGVRVVRVQRWHDKYHAQIMKQFLRPLADALGMWLIYEIDDVLTYEDIPDYNVAKPYFSPERIGNSVQEIFDCCDMITVTTEELKNLYIEKLHQDPKKFFVIPNYLPRWWIGESYNLDHQLKQWDANRKHPHLGFACSTNHFDVNNSNKGEDDFTALIPWVKKNVDKYKFHFVGGVPQQLMEEAKSGKVIVQQPSDIINYPREMKLRGFDLLIAPLINSAFNRCKSNIKWLEFAALGIPMIGQNISTYNQYTDQLFDTTDDIDEWVDKLFFRKDSRDFYSNIIQKNRKIVEGSGPNTGYWLERNIQKYFELYSIPQNTVKFQF